MRRFTAGVVLATTVLMPGCGDSGGADGGGGQTIQEQQANRGLDDVRAFLQGVANSGDISFSEMYGMDQTLKDAGKPELVEDLNRLGQSRGERAKKIANEMLQKL